MQIVILIDTSFWVNVKLPLGIAFALSAVGIVFFMIYHETQENAERIKQGNESKYKEPTFRRNTFWVLCWGGLIFFTISSLFCFNIFHLEENSSNPVYSKLDGIIWVMTILGIIGAFWAIFARIDAERAFQQSKKTYDALGSTFDFISILDPSKLPEIIKQIGEPATTISLYIGFPIVGLPYWNNKNLRTKPSKVFIDLIGKLTNIKNYIDNNDMINNFYVNIGYISKNESIRILDGIPDIKVEEKEILKNRLNDFYLLIEYYKKRDHPNIKVIEFSLSEKFRFVTYYKEKKQSFVWIVDLKEDSVSGNIISRFDSVVFRTEEDKFVTLLEKVFLL